MKNNETLFWVLLGVIVLLVLLGGYGMMGYGSSAYGYDGMIGMMYGSYGTGMMFFGWLYGILVLVALVLFIVWLVKQIQK